MLQRQCLAPCLQRRASHAQAPPKCGLRWSRTPRVMVLAGANKDDSRVWRRAVVSFPRCSAARESSTKTPGRLDCTPGLLRHLDWCTDSCTCMLWVICCSPWACSAVQHRERGPQCGPPHTCTCSVFALCINTPPPPPPPRQHLTSGNDTQVWGDTRVLSGPCSGMFDAVGHCVGGACVPACTRAQCKPTSITCAHVDTTTLQFTCAQTHKHTHSHTLRLCFPRGLWVC